MTSKTLYIIAGCNGAGKTTASVSILPEILKCREFVNADEIAKGLSPFNPESVAIEAGRLMLDRINVLVEGNNSNPRVVIATGHGDIVDVKNDILYRKIKNYV